jgi:competence protein ComEC
VKTAIRIAFALAFALLVGPFSTWARAGQPCLIEFLDVGQGDSVLIRSPEGKTILVDAGTSNHVVETLKQRGVKTIDLVAVSHHHSDHYGGMGAVIKQFHPKFFLATNAGHTTSSYLKLLKLVQEEGITAVHPTEKPRKIELGSLVLTIFPQPPEDKDEENNNSIGIRLDDGLVSLVMTGDSEETERAWWVKNCPNLLKDAAILKLAHHGSRNGTDAKWLDLIKPELTVASLGAGNTYGHPHAETLSLLSRMRIPLKRTDQDGTITIESDGKQWKLASPSQLANRPKSEPRAASRRTSPRSKETESPTTRVR